MRSLRVRLIVAALAVLLASGALTFLALHRAFRASALSAQEEKMKGLVYAVLGSIDLGEDGTLRFDELAV